MIELRRLSPADGEDVYQMLQTIPADENGLMNTAHGLNYAQFREWLKAKQADAEQVGLVDGWKVPSTTYWLYADGRPVGFGNLRHCLTDALRHAGGHIGYGIAPGERGKGYGKALLRLLLEEARAKGIQQALVTIYADNAASQAVARANGGVVTEKNAARVYVWFDLT